MPASSSRDVLVTGAAGGLGRATARYLARQGFRVFAADLRPAEIADAGPGQIVPVSLDVTDPASIEEAVAEVGRRSSGLAGVVHFAGIMGVGAMIDLPDADLQRVFTINVFGVARVNRACFDLVRAGGGRIVLISSETGWQTAAPFNGPYAMTKHAIEAYADALRRELSLLDVAVVTLEPGPFATEMSASVGGAFDRAAAASPHFGATISRLRHVAVAAAARGADPVVCARAVHRALLRPNPAPRYRVRTAPGRALLELLPTRLSDAVIMLGMRWVIKRG